MRVWEAPGEARPGQGRAGQGRASRVGRLAGSAGQSDTGRGGRCVHDKVNMVPSRGTCTLLAPHRGRWSQARGVGGGGRKTEGCRRGRAICVCTNQPQVRCHTDPPWEPRARPDSSGPSLATACCLSSARAKGEPCDPPRTRDPGLSLLPRRCGPGRGNARARHRPPPPTPTLPPRADRPGEARPQDSGRGCQGDIFSGTARFQRPPPAQLAGSLSTFLQTGSPAVTGCQAARGLGESSAYGGALAGASGPGVLGCSNPA